MIRLAIVGFGNVARHHIAVLRDLGADVVAAFNRSSEGRDRARSEGGIPQTYSSLAEMLDRETPDGIVCCASFENIYSVGRELIPRGIPVLLEKPPGLSLQEAQDLSALADEAGTRVVVGMNRRHYSVLQRALEDAGGVGAITGVWVDWSESPGVWRERGVDRSLVDRMVFANSLHGLDLLTYLGGSFADVDIHTRALTGGEFRWFMSLEGVSSRGVTGGFRSSWDAPLPWRLIFTTRGRAYVFSPLESCRVYEGRSREAREIGPSDADQRFKVGFHAQADHFLEFVAGPSDTTPHGLRSTLPAMELAERLTSGLAADAGHAAL